jgi:hypothetical protein
MNKMTDTSKAKQKLDEDEPQAGNAQKKEEIASGTGTDENKEKPVLKRVNALKNLQMKMLDVEAQFYEELHELECKYARLYEPFLEQRRKIVVGEQEPTEEEGKWALDELNESSSGDGGAANPKVIEETDQSKLYDSGKKLLEQLKSQFKQNDIDKSTAAAEQSQEKGIGNFWLETLQSFRMTGERIEPQDEPILAYLQDIRCVLFDEKPMGFRLEFHFAENPFFTNKILTKSYYLKNQVDKMDPFSYEGPDLDKTLGCKIDWKTGKNVTVKLIKKKLKAKNKKAAPKIITKEEKQQSFFNFFETPKASHKRSDSKSASGAEDADSRDKKDDTKHAKSKKDDDGDDDENDEIDKEGNEEELHLIEDFEIGQYIKEKIVPRAILYYTNEYVEEEDYEDGYEDDLDVLEDDKEDDEAEGEEKKNNKSNKKNSKREAGEPNPSECKQN